MAATICAAYIHTYTRTNVEKRKKSKSRKLPTKSADNDSEKWTMRYHYMSDVKLTKIGANAVKYTQKRRQFLYDTIEVISVSINKNRLKRNVVVERKVMSRI